MKTSLLLAATALVFLSASCRTAVPLDPLTFKPDPSRLPAESVEPTAKSDCSKKSCKSTCGCKKDKAIVNGTK